jgi:hypothetical protein
LNRSRSLLPAAVYLSYRKITERPFWTGLAEAERREIVSDDEMAAIWKKCRL